MYEQAVLNRYADMNENNAKMSEQQNKRYADMYEKLKNRNTFQKMDLTPLTALVDNETGSNFTKSYNKPISDVEAEQLYGKNTGDIHNRNNSTMDRYGNLLNYFAKKQPKDSFADWKRKKDYEHALKGNESEKFSSDQHKAATFSQRMTDAESDFSRITDKEGYNPSNQWNAFARKWSPDFAKDDDHKSYEQAMRNFIAAQLRRESGAAISEGEYDTGRRIYFPQAGDTEDVLAQKERARQAAILGMQEEAGGAFKKLNNRVNKERGMKRTSNGGNDDRIKMFMQRNNITDPAEAQRILREKGIIS